MKIDFPLVVNTKEECIKLNNIFKINRIAVSLDWYINGKYELPLVIYSDSGNYENNENYLHSSINNLSKNRQIEIEKYIKLEGI